MEMRTRKQEYSIAHLTVMGLSPQELVYVAARAGYDYVSPRLIYMGLPGEPRVDKDVPFRDIPRGR